MSRPISPPCTPRACGRARPIPIRRTRGAGCVPIVELIEDHAMFVGWDARPVSFTDIMIRPSFRRALRQTSPWVVNLIRIVYDFRMTCRRRVRSPTPWAGPCAFRLARQAFVGSQVLANARDSLQDCGHVERFTHQFQAGPCHCWLGPIHPGSIIQVLALIKIRAADHSLEFHLSPLEALFSVLIIQYNFAVR